MRYPTALAALGVALVTAWTTVPVAMRFTYLSPDAIEHLGVAHAWASGAGFVNPIEWSYFVHTGVPYPAHALRAPLVSVLLAVPLRFGASIPTVGVLHAAWASLVAGGIVLVGARLMRLPAAITAAGLIAWSPAWSMVSVYPWTEATAVATLLLVVATVRGAARCVPGALVCAAATLLAAAARPNGGLLAPVVAAAIAHDLGWRRALRHVPLATYLVAVTVGIVGIRAVATALTGYPPYVGYGLVWQVLRTMDAARYYAAYPGIATFIHAHAPQILAGMARNARRLRDDLFVPARPYGGVGWAILLVIAHAVARRRRLGIEHTILVLAAATSALVVVLAWSTYASSRFPLMPAVAIALAGLAGADDLLAGLADSRRVPGWIHLTPLVALVLLTGPGLRESLTWPPDAYAAYARRAAMPPRHPMRALCHLFDPDAIVVSDSPWDTFRFCGNATLVMPTDLRPDPSAARFIAEQRPAFFVTDGRPTSHWLATFPRVERLGANGGFTVYAVRGVQASPAWHAPPPLDCAGHPTCTR